MHLLFSLVLSAALSICAFSQGLSYSGTPAPLNNVTISLQGTPNQPYILAASDSAGPTVVAPLGTFELGYPPVLLAGAVPGFPFTPSLDAQGNVSLTLGIPFNTSLVGETWWFQGVYFDPTSPYGLSKTNGIHFTVADPLLAPTVTSVTPNTGPAAGGNTVAIFGSNFLPGGTTVTFGNSPMLNMVVATPTLITGQVPQGVAGASVPVTVSTVIGGPAVLGNGYTYQGNFPPVIASVSPEHAPITGGVAITLVGQGLGPGTSVYANGVFVAPISQSNTQFVGILPPTANPGYASLLAFSPNGVAATSTSFRYTAVYDFGTGADGVFAPTSNTQLNTAQNGGVFNFTSVTIPAGVTVRGVGPNPLIIKCTGTITINGVLDVSGEDGNWFPVVDPSVAQSAVVMQGGSGGYAGGGYGSTGVPSSSNHAILFVASLPQGPGAHPSSAVFGTYASGASCGNCVPTTYGSPTLSFLVGGSGAGGGYAFLNSGGIYSPTRIASGGGGGGAVSLQSAGMNVAGRILANGGNGVLVNTNPFANYSGSSYAGSGGAIRIMSASPVLVMLDSLQTRSGLIIRDQLTPPQPPLADQSGRGRWAIYSWNGTISYGVEGTTPPGTY